MKIRTHFLCAILLIVLIGSAMADDKPITISTNNTPLDRKALQLLSLEVSRRIGVEFRLVSHPSERSLQLANQGDVDGEGLRIAGLASQYPNLIQVPERFLGISFVAFSKDAMINLDQGWAGLKPYRVGFITGWKMFEANASTARVVNKVDQAEQMFQMLDGGRIDLALYTRADGMALIRRMGLSTIAPLSPALKDVDMFLYLNKKHDALVPQIARALREMKADGTYNKLMFSLWSE
jgi:polar amino acid transport system substrate-binding protein